MIICFTPEVQSAIRYFAPTENDNYYASTPPGDIRQCCLFEVGTEEVLLNVFGQDDCWLQQRVKTTLSPSGIKMLVTRDSLEKLKKFPSDTQLELKETADGIAATSFREFNSKGQPIRLDRVILQPYPGTLDAFPTPDLEGDLIAEVPAKQFYELIATVIDCGEHKKDKTRPVRLSINPFKLETNAATCSKFRFQLSTPSTGKKMEPWMIRGSHLPLMLGVTSKSSESSVQILYSPGVPLERAESLVFCGDLGSAKIPIQKGADFESFKRGLDYISILSSREEIDAQRQIHRERLEDALKIQNPGVATTPAVVMFEEGTNLCLSKKGDATKKEMSNLPFTIQQDLKSWVEISVDYNALVLLTNLMRRLKTIHDVETDSITFRLAHHSAINQRARRQSRQNDYLLDVVLSEKQGDYQVVIPVIPEQKQNEIPEKVDSNPDHVEVAA